MIYKEVVSNLQNTTFSEASVWADKVKNTKKYRWSKPLHYMNINECLPQNNPITYCEKRHCIYTGISNFTKNLKFIPSNEEDLKFLLHLAQDMNQPLHLFGLYRGGNQYKIIRNKNGFNKTTNLHALWDNEIPDFYIKNYNYTPQVKLVEITDYNMFLDDIISSNIGIACKYVYNFTDDYVIFKDYFKKEAIEQLFDNYFFLIVNTLRYIYRQ
jgi:hypothetical protein